MAVPTYNQTLDTMVTTAIDTFSRDPINALTDSGEKFLKQAAQSGRVFVVNDAENVRHPILYGHGENSSLYTPDLISGTPDAQNNLGSAASEILTHALFRIQAGTRNINFPQSQPPGNMIDYVSSVVKANMMKIFNEEEILFVQGRPLGSTGQLVPHDPHDADTNFVAGYPMALSGVMTGSSTPSPQADGDTTDETWANIKTDDVPKWQQTFQAATTGTAYGSIIADMQSAVLSATYSDVERPTHVYMTLAGFEKFLAAHRALGALPDPVNANLGKEGTVSFGGMTIDWSRYLANDVQWDLINVEADEASAPVLGINWNSLRLNTVRAGTPGSDDLGFIRQLGDLQPHPTATNLFKRIEWKRQWSVDNGRRSFFTIYGNIDA